MAKKAAMKGGTTAKAGWKACENSKCNWYFGTKASTCPKCGTTRTTTTKPTKKSKPAKSIDMDSAMATIEQLGGYDQVKAKVDQLRELADELGQLGSLDEINEQMARIEKARSL